MLFLLRKLQLSIVTLKRDADNQVNREKVKTVIFHLPGEKLEVKYYVFDFFPV